MTELIHLSKVGVPGPPGPASVSPGAIITSRGIIIVGGPGGSAFALALGPAGQYLRSNGTDLLYSAILAGDLPAAIDAAKIGAGLVSNTEFGYLNGVSAALQGQLDAKAAIDHVHLDRAQRGIFTAANAFSLPDTDNTSSTSTWATALDETLTLPTGHWKVTARGAVSLRHSAAGTVAMRVTIDGQDSTFRTFSVTSASLFTTVEDTDSNSDVDGSFHVLVQFRSSDPGTTYAKNPAYFLIAERVS